MIDKLAKWGALFAIVSSILVMLFQEFTPKYMEWRKNYPSESDTYEDDAPDGGGLVDPIADMNANPQNPLFPQQ